LKRSYNLQGRQQREPVKKPPEKTYEERARDVHEQDADREYSPEQLVIKSRNGIAQDRTYRPTQGNRDKFHTVSFSMDDDYISTKVAIPGMGLWYNFKYDKEDDKNGAGLADKVQLRLDFRDLALMAGLHSEANAKISIMAGILVIAFADNISDSFGIHIFQESENVETREVWTSTILNFISRIVVSLSFVALILFLPLNTAIMTSMVWGLLLLAAVSYMIAKNEAGSPYLSIFTHILIAVVVIFLSNLAGDVLISRFGK
jgi:hypothetical protein